MVFVTEIKQHLEVATHICHFRDTIAYYREVIKEASKKLDLKGAAWLAGFPVGNTLLNLRRNGDGDAKFEDYLGPSIDNGFRLSKHATPRKFMLSVETAYLLLASARSGRVQRPEVFLERGEELKGVLDGRPYPKLWIGVPYRSAEKFRELEEKLLDPPHDHAEAKIHEYCKLFIDEYGSPLFVPFIESDPLFGIPPEGYDKQYAEVRDLWTEKMGQHLKHEPTVSGNAPQNRDLEQKIAKLKKNRPVKAKVKAKAVIPKKRRRPAQSKRRLK